MNKKDIPFALVNPKALYGHGLELCISMLTVHRWNILRSQMVEIQMEVNALFGRFDLLCKHYRTMDYDTTGILTEFNIAEPLYSNVTPFRVERIDKMNGLDIPWDDEVDFELNQNVLKNLDALQQDWMSVSDEIRQDLILKRVILPTPVTPGVQLKNDTIGAFVFVRLPVISTEEFMFHRKYLAATTFRERKDSIIGVYWTSAQASYHCILELAVSSMGELIAFVMDDLQGIRDIGVETATYIIVDIVSSKWLPVSHMLKKIPTEILDETLRSVQDIWGRVKEIITKFDPEIATKLPNVTNKNRIRCVALFDRISSIIDSIVENTNDTDVVRIVTTARLRATEAFLFRENHFFADVAANLGPCIERVFRRLLARRAWVKFEGKRGDMQKALKLKSAKADYFPEGMTGGDVANAISQWNKNYPDDEIIPQEILTRWQLFRKLRDKAAHARPMEFEAAVSSTFEGFKVIQMFFEIQKKDKTKFDYSWRQ